MEKPLIRSMMPIFIVLIILMVGLDLVIDGLDKHSLMSALVHVGFAALIIAAAHLLANRAAASRRKAEALMRQAQEELEARVQGRTVDLKLTNETLRMEITEHVQAEIERERLITQMEAARQKAEGLVTELHLANNMLVTLIDTLPAGMIIIDAEKRVVLANEKARALMKTALAGDTYALRDELSLRRDDGSIIEHDDLPLVRAIQFGEISTGLEVGCCLESGECVDLLIAASPVRNADGEIIYAVKILLDITTLKTMKKALRVSEERYRAQFDAFSEPTTVWDRGGRLLMQNLVSARNMNGVREDFIGKTIFDIFGESGADYLERIRRVIDTGVAEYQEDVVDLPKGKRYFWTCIQSIPNPNGQAAAQILSYDITERRQNEDALRVSEEKFSTVFHYSPNPVGIVRASDGVLLEINQAFSTVSGWPRSELIGRNWREPGFVAALEEQEPLLRQFEEKGSLQDYEVRSRDRNGNPIILLLSLIPITIREEGCVLVIGHDITERKNAEELLRQTQVELERGHQERLVLQERQRLARELHDSVSQALYGISLGAHTALALFDTDREKVLGAVNYILGLSQAGLTEMRALIFELRPESLKLEGLVTAIGKQTAALRARHGIEVDFQACPEPDVPYKVKEALYRIAQEAMQNALKHARPSRLEVDLCSDAELIQLDIIDDGVGFDPDASYPGHLGLQSMRERATELHGSCDITSQLTRGAQVRVRIPLRPNSELMEA